jgi:hypothetical protein
MILTERVFRGVYPAGLVYADRQHEVDGDYARLAFLPFDTLTPVWQATCPRALRPEIQADMDTIRARRGEQFEISTCGQTVLLGSYYSRRR